ncbi:hypothetical protein [Pseudomonas asiatica]|uniref:hypothetical protein n=1 Tax=Pseudomonas asiatica TaxID=2219225 RepID=UPI003208DCD2
MAKRLTIWLCRCPTAPDQDVAVAFGRIILQRLLKPLGDRIGGGVADEDFLPDQVEPLGGVVRLKRLAGGLGEAAVLRDEDHSSIS